MISKIKYYLWAELGIVCLSLGTLGIAVPILPTVPFYMATAFCFAKSSKKLHDWFTASELYKKHLESFMESRAMTLKTKLSIMSMATAMMALGFFMMKSVPIGRICLGIVWVFHVFYFIFRIKTIPEKQTDEVLTEE